MQFEEPDEKALLSSTTTPSTLLLRVEHQPVRLPSHVVVEPHGVVRLQERRPLCIAGTSGSTIELGVGCFLQGMHGPADVDGEDEEEVAGGQNRGRSAGVGARCALDRRSCNARRCVPRQSRSAISGVQRSMLVIWRSACRSRQPRAHPDVEQIVEAPPITSMARPQVRAR